MIDVASLTRPNYELTAMIRIKRVYEPPAPEDGYRVLVDRLWPRGLTRKDAVIDAWLKELAPSTELRRWFGGEDASCSEFARKYRKELAAPELAAGLADLRARARRGAVTLLYAKRDVQENNAVVLRDYLEAQRTRSVTKPVRR